MLTPEEIQSREFLVSLRGYDRDEVHAFLGRVAEQLAQTEARAAQLQQRLDRLKAQQPALAATAEPSPAAAQAPGSPEPSAMFAEIGKETQRILEAAQEAGQQIQRKARQDADRELQSARGQAAKLIAEGERRREHIERVVSELEQHRAAMSVQLRGVARTIESTLKDLAPSDGGATVREAIAAQAGDRQTPPPSDTAQEELADEGEAPAPPPEGTAAADDAPPAPDRGDRASTDTPAAPAPAAGDQGADDQVSDEPALGPDERAEQPAAPAPAEPAVSEEASAADQAGEKRDTGEGAGATATTADEPAGATVAAATEPSLTAAPEPTAAAPAAEGGASQDAQALRASALSPLHPKLVRKVKRELQEIQNIALDKVRRTKGQGEVDDFLPSDDDTSGLAEGAAELLEQAWRAGTGSAQTLAGRDLGEPSDVPDLGADFMRDAGERVRSGLSSTLRMGLGAQESAQGLSDRIGSAFTEFKGAQAEELAATHLIRAYEYGLLAAWKAGGIDARRWVMGREPRCPEARCRTNDQGGDVAVGESFPSGHDVPPVHVGCTCTTVPAVDSSS